MRISDWSSDVCSSDLRVAHLGGILAAVAILEEDLLDDAVVRHHGVAPGARAEAAATLVRQHAHGAGEVAVAVGQQRHLVLDALVARPGVHHEGVVHGDTRSEKHTSELQSLMSISYAVFCLTKTT